MLNVNKYLQKIQSNKTSISNRLSLRRLRKGFRLKCPVENYYFVTTEKGIFLIGPNEGRLLSMYPGYGLAIAEDMAFFSIDYKNGSYVCMLTKERLLNGVRDDFDQQADILYKSAFHSNNERIHQITLTKDRKVLLANCARNSIVSVDPATYEVKEFTPFPDMYGMPILYDHNHINSVIEVDGMVFFVAYKVGGKSFVGWISEDIVSGYFFANKGMHDIYKTETGFLIFDTFGNGKGRAITEEGEIFYEYLDRDDGYVLRGAAGSKSEWLFGHSHKGPRRTRYLGYGGILVISMGECHYVELPASQIYQIIRFDGRFFEQCNDDSRPITEHMRSSFGAPVELGPIVHI